MTTQINHSWYVKPADIPTEVAAGGVILRREQGRILVALIREGTLPAFVLPKGHVESGESLLTTAQREIAEEAGLSQLQYLGDLGCLERLDYRKKHWKITHYYLFATEQVDGVPTDQSMAYRVAWFPLEDLPEIFWPEQRQLLETLQGQIQQYL